MRVLVTGGTGFLGSHVVDRLLEEPDTEVYALVRNPSKLRWLEGHDRVRLLKGDLLDLPPLPAGLSWVLHLAGLTKTLKSSEYYTVNQEGTASLLRALDALPGAPRFVQLSSIAAAGPSGPNNKVREDDPPRPVSAYGESKLLAEKEVLKYRQRFPVIILRAAAIYGPRDEDFLQYFRWAKRGITLLVGHRDKTLSLCFIRDAARAVLLAARAPVPSGEIFNIADPTGYSWENVGHMAGRILGKKPIPLRFPHWAIFLASAASEGIGRIGGGGANVLNVSKYKQMKPDFWVADTRKARERLGFQSRFSIEAGLKETLAWYLARDLL